MNIDQFVLAAKAIIYNAKRMAALIKMMDTQAGAINAVKTVIAGIEQQKPVPPELVPELAKEVFKLLVDVCILKTGQKPGKEALQGTMKMILAEMQKAYPRGQQAPQQPAGQPQAAPQQPGLLAQGMA